VIGGGKVKKSIFEVKHEWFEDLSEEEKKSASNNGSGKEYASYIRIKHNGETILLESDAIEPEDATFSRDLSWIVEWLKKSYELGMKDAL
jgi:hypothetical protein